MTLGRQTVLSDLLAAPGLSAAILGAGAAHIGLCASGLGGWPCPFYHATGWPCPGCGLGRACVLLLRGQWADSLRMHAFAPVLLLTLALLGIGLVLRGRPRARLLAWVARVEEKARPAAILLPALVFYWLCRMVLDGVHFRLLIS